MADKTIGGCVQTPFASTIESRTYIGWDHASIHLAATWIARDARPQQLVLHIYFWLPKNLDTILKPTQLLSSTTSNNLLLKTYNPLKLCDALEHLLIATNHREDPKENTQKFGPPGDSILSQKNCRRRQAQWSSLWWIMDSSNTFKQHYA